MAQATDVLIVGGGPAGLAAALALRQRGASVTVADTRKPPIDKACGEGLMPDSLHELARLGVELSSADGAAFRGIRFASQCERAGDAVVATAHFPAGAGIGLKRQTLHARLVEQAEQAGVQLRWQTTVQLRDNEAVSLAGQPARYGLLVGADGQSSRVRRWAGLERGATMSRRFGFRQHLRVEPWSSYVEVHWGPSGQAYVTPVGDNEVCVATVARDPHCRSQQILDEIPSLRARLGERIEATDTERGAVTTTRRLRRVAIEDSIRGGVALIGDASGTADAITGEGMGMAFRQAMLLAECVEQGDLARYNRLHPQTLKLPQTMARIMLLMDRSAGFQRRALGMLAAEPSLFTRMLGVHLGAESLPSFLATKGPEVAWRLAFPFGMQAETIAPL